MDFSIEKCAMLIRKKGKKEKQRNKQNYKIKKALERLER